MQTYNSGDAVRIYVLPSYKQPVLWHTWRPLHGVGGRCLVFPTAEQGERALARIITDTWDPAGIWRMFSGAARTICELRKPPRAVYSAEENPFGQSDLMSRVVPPGCVVVAIAHYTDKAPTPVRDIRVFVGTHGCGPDGPLFFDIPVTSEEDLLCAHVLSMAALSNLG